MHLEKKADIAAERNGLVCRFEQLSMEWAKLDAGSADAKQKVAERNQLAKQLSQSYWNLDPYVRARSYYDRVGVIDSLGRVDYKAAQ
jgi:hypothetical protein